MTPKISGISPGDFQKISMNSCAFILIAPEKGQRYFSGRDKWRIIPIAEGCIAGIQNYWQHCRPRWRNYDKSLSSGYDVKTLIHDPDMGLIGNPAAGCRYPEKGWNQNPVSRITLFYIHHGKELSSADNHRIVNRSLWSSSPFPEEPKINRKNPFFFWKNLIFLFNYPHES